MKKIIFTETAPKPIGAYSQAVLAKGEFIFISGQIPLDLNGNIVGDAIELQTKQVFNNIENILKSQNLSINDIVKVTVLLSDLTDFEKMDSMFNSFFLDSKPARATYEVSRLPKDVKIEIEAIAVK